MQSILESYMVHHPIVNRNPSLLRIMIKAIHRIVVVAVMKMILRVEWMPVNSTRTSRMSKILPAGLRFFKKGRSNDPDDSFRNDDDDVSESSAFDDLKD
jgi:hypothetical protein